MKIVMKLRYFLFLFTSFLSSQEVIREIGELPKEVYESSGLIFYNGGVVTLNDSGNSPQLFEIDTLSLKIKRTITISNANNIDWEDIDQDEQFIYIGDFGNNLGTRQDLVIYRISKDEFNQSDTVSAESIFFSYEDQSSFENVGSSDWDSEALFVLDDQLVILTKQWQSNGTVAYAIPKVPGSHRAKKLDVYANSGLITGANYNPQTKELMAVGYSQFLNPFVIRVEGATVNSIFGGKVEKTNLDIDMAQVEGITFAGDHTYLFSSEFFSRNTPSITSKSRLFSSEIKKKDEPETLEEPSNPLPEILEPLNDNLVLFSQHNSGVLEYKLTTEEYVVGRAIFDTSGKLVKYDPVINLTEDSVIDLSTLKSAVYYITFYLGGEVISRPFYRN